MDKFTKATKEIFTVVNKHSVILGVHRIELIRAMYEAEKEALELDKSKRR